MVAMALWHLELRPGQPESVYVRRDFQITNIALGEELADSTGRSVVKVTHSPINPVLLESDDEDSEDEDFDESEDDEEDEESEDDVPAKAGKKGGKEGKTVEEVEDDEDMEDDLSEGSDFSFDQPAATAVIAALTPSKIEQVTTNLIFVKDEAVIFEVTGKNVVHLMGNYIHQDVGGHDHDHHDDYDDLDSEYDEDEEIDSDDEEMGSITSSQVEDMEKLFGSKEQKQARVELLDENEESTSAPKASNKRKAEQQEVDSPAKVAAAAATKAEGGDDLSKNAKKKLAKKQKLENGAAAPAEAVKEVKEVKEAAKEKPAAAPKEAKKSNKQTLPSGLVIEDTKLGEGPVAKPGKRLGMRYIGKLTNGKQFDANTAGAPFKFVLGRGEVIKGWDQGISGMKVGGERRLTIPAALAYGKQKLPGIPPNSTLVFEIKLVDVK